MKEVRLTDLDELALKVRDRIARSYILEAIDAYRGGAYRSSIVSTWIAVNFDIISKIRYLSNQGDQRAENFVKKLDENIANKNVIELQKIEGDLLKEATKEFEFLSAQEKVDLERLKDDRNLCAHPVFVAEEMLFEPEPERVRMHIVHVIKHLLQHKPVQGKSAINRIVRDITSPSFPDTLDAAYIFLNSRYLDRAKNSLIKNLILLLLKAILKNNLILEDMPELYSLKYSRQMILTLQAISKRHPDIYEKLMEEKLNDIVESLEEDRFPNAFRLLGADPRCWNWLDESTKIQFKTITKVSSNNPNPDIHNSVLEAISVNDLKPIIVKGFSELSTEIQINLIKATPHPEFAAKAIDLYSKANSYNDANRLGDSVISPMANYFSVADIQKILKSVEKNNQIYNATGTPEILDELFEKTKQYLPQLSDSWRSLFEFLLSSDDSRFNYKEKDPYVWSYQTKWTNLLNHLKAAGVSLPPGFPPENQAEQ